MSVSFTCRFLGYRKFQSKKGNDCVVVDLYAKGVGCFCSFVSSDTLFDKVHSLEEGESYEMSFELSPDSQKNLVCKLSDVKI